ncbi:MAG: 4Fe-4S binding protein [Dorea sp.]
MTVLAADYVNGKRPAKAIEIQDGKPVWIKEDCYVCMACLNYCPVEAIDYGKYSKGRFRYFFKGFSKENY